MIEFSSPIGESTFSTHDSKTVIARARWSFRPLSGNLLSLHVWTRGKKWNVVFSSPIGESTFSTISICTKGQANGVFVPYRGIYFLYSNFLFCHYRFLRFRPLSGNLLSLPCITMERIVSCSFRPLSGNLLSLREQKLWAKLKWTVFVPYRGIYFLYPCL